MKKVKVMSSVAGYTLAAPTYDEKEKYLNSFEKGRIMPLFGELKGKHVLDVGAGTGRLSVQIAKAGANVIALDIVEPMLNVLRQKDNRINTVISDAEDMPFLTGTFDIVVATFFIVHLKDLTRFFDEVYRVLKDGGIFVVTNINQKEPPIVSTYHGDIMIESHYHRPEKIRELLESLAFSIKTEEFVKENDVWVNQIIVAKK